MSAYGTKLTLSERPCCNAQRFPFDMVGWRRRVMEAHEATSLSRADEAIE
jgi:hypothetical protein